MAYFPILSMNIPKTEIFALFTHYQVEWYINIIKNSKRSLSYDPLHDEVSFDEKNTLSTVLTIIKNHRKTVFKMDGFSMPGIQSAFEDVLWVIDFWEYDEDIVLPKIEKPASNTNDFSCFSLPEYSFSQMEHLFETVKNFSPPQDIYLEGFSVGIHEQTHIFLNSQKIYQEQKHTHSSLFIEYFGENGSVRDTHYLYENTLDFPKITTEKLHTLTQELQTKLTTRDPFPAGVYTITLDRDIVIEFIDILLENLSAQNMREWLSIFSLESIEKKVLWDNFSLINTPILKNYTGNSAFTSEWIPTKKYTLFENGYLRSVFCDYKNSQKCNKKFLWNAGVYNIEMIFEENPDFLQKSNLLITNLMAFHTVDAHTWKFSLAGEWYILKNGTKIGYTTDITLSGNIVDLFSNIIAFGDDTKENGNMKIPSLTISNQTIS